MRKYFLALIAFLLFAFTGQVSISEEKTSFPSANIILAIATSEQISDNRVKILRKFLEERNSPLADYSEDFVRDADKYNLDWMLVAAISGLESSYGLAIPPGSYNGWGWGIYGTN